MRKQKRRMHDSCGLQTTKRHTTTILVRRSTNLLPHHQMTPFTKGQVTTIGPVQAIGLLLAVILIIITVSFFWRFGGLLGDSSIEQATDVSYRTFIAELNELLKQEEQCSTKTGGHNIFVGIDFSIVAFNKGEKQTQNGCVISEKIQRPLRPDCPTDKTCVCLYKVDEEFEDTQPKQCMTTDADFIFMRSEKNNQNDRISANMYGGKEQTLPALSIKPQLKYPPITQLTIFGQCDNNVIDEDFQTQRLYLEKIKAEKTILFVAHYDEQMQKRETDCTPT